MATIRTAATDVDAWLALRTKLWPGTLVDENRQELVQQPAEPQRCIGLLAFDAGGHAIGVAEATVRVDFVTGCLTSPVAFLEGIFVEPAQQRRGNARAPCAAVERWAVARGGTELASEAPFENDAGHDFQRSVGFTPTERVIFYRKELS